jgi:hypothetical protein
LIVKIDIPGWAIGKHIYIFAGAELLADKRAETYFENGKHKSRYFPLRIKTERCNGCGDCCSTVGINKTLLKDMQIALNKNSNNGCPFNSVDGCILRAWIPFACVKSVCSHYENCNEKLEEVR